MRRFLALLLLTVSTAFAVDMTHFNLPCEANARGAIVTGLVGAKSRSTDLVANVNGTIAAWTLVSFDPNTFGFLASCDGDNSCSITASSAVLTSLDQCWSAADVGKTVHVQGAGAAAGTLVASISAYTSPTSVTLSTAAGTTVTASKTSKAGIAIWGYVASKISEIPPLTNPAGTLAYTRGENSPSANFYDIGTFGCVADGVTDNLAAINLAITTANAAGGGIVRFGAGSYFHSAAITMKPNVTLLGVGNKATTLLSTHTGDGVSTTSAINSSVAVNTTMEDIGIKNTNGSNVSGGYDDVGGTFITLRNVRIEGFKYGVIFDQSELASVELCDFENQILACVWLVNGAEHTTGASGLFTNRISIDRSQFNAGVSCWGILDDGGNAHAFTDNNFNGCLGHLRIAGVQNLSVRGSEFESASGPCVVLTNVSLGAAGKGAALNLKFDNCEFIPIAGQACANIVSAGIVSWHNCLFGNTAAVKIGGSGNVAAMDFIECFNAGGGATTTGSSTKMLTWDTNGFTLAQSGNGAGVKSYLSATGALSFGAPGAVPGAVDLTVTVTGAAVGDTVAFGPGVTIPANYQATAWVSAAGTVTVRLLQFAGAATAQNLGTCRVGVWQH